MHGLPPLMPLSGRQRREEAVAVASPPASPALQGLPAGALSSPPTPLHGTPLLLLLLLLLQILETPSLLAASGGGGFGLKGKQQAQQSSCCG